MFLINAHLEEDVFIRREALKKVHRLLTFLDFKVGVYFNLRFYMKETDELNVTPLLSPSYEGKPAVYTGRVLCQICSTGCLKKTVNREKLEKIPNIEHFKETALRWKTVVMITKGYMHLLIWKKGKKWCIKPAKEHYLREVFLFQNRKKLQLWQVFLITLMQMLPFRTRPVSILQYKSSLDNRNCIICNEIKYGKGRKVSLLSMTLKKHGKENH